MRDHPDTPAGGRRGRLLIEAHLERARTEEAAWAGAWPPAEPGTVPVPAPLARFRREFFGADAYQPTNDQRTRLSHADLAVLEEVDGARTTDEIAARLAARHETRSLAAADVRQTLDRLVAGHALRWATVRKPRRAPVVERHEEEFSSFDRLSSPINVLWEPSLLCNLRCAFCYNASGPDGDRGRDRTGVARQFVESGALQVTIIGGEPLVLPDFWELVDQLEESGVGVDFVTNGWHVDESRVARLEQTNICQLMVSIDGLEETHDRLRGRKGSFRRALEGVRLLSAAGFEVTVAPCVQRSNVDELEALIDAVAEAGAARMKIRPMIAEGRALNVFDEHGLRLAEIERYQEMIRRKAAEYRGRMSVVHRMPAAELGVCACDYNPACPGIIARLKGTCGIGRLMCYVRTDGGVAPNSNLREHVVGNVFDTPFKEIWQDEARWAGARPPNRAGAGVLNF